MHISKLLFVLPYLINLILHDRTVTQLALGKSARDLNDCVQQASMNESMSMGCIMYVYSYICQKPRI